MINLLSYLCIGVGLFFWFWGTSSLLTQRSVLFKLHNLSVSDTLGSISIITGLLLLRPREWPLLLLAILSLVLWNTMLGYVLAYCSSSSPSRTLNFRRRSDG
ncbi:monovalent cation/H(+) antiporter subunit G [Leptolyngbya sp. FACHB-541]|uniref:monovalent cation/H(+) antiporter subunit G n=1 Tax=Leptolyngbya sp. FACHB-541 TaxID=2692810 RepID=UPI001682E284|nr:monovalent cation/H(+) antiporter subunit G [Leptolyngbya sp. FACHB-541]MBD1996597.1 monovalent cation/H(+) antiporter subunit G [Leptolyngbya sp. FACHB-541]